MKLNRFEIKNFRGISEVKFNAFDFTSLIGPNNCGKSSILQALVIFLNQEKPTSSDWPKGSESEEIILTAEFTELQQWEREIPGISGIIQDDKILLRVRYEKPGAKGIYEAFKKQEVISEWSDKIGDLKKSWIGEHLAAAEITAAADLKITHKIESLKQILRTTAPDKITITASDWTSENISIDAALKQAIPQAELIPAVKDASDDTKPQAKTTFGRILNSVILPAIQDTDEYTALRESVENLSKKIKGANGVAQPEQIKLLADAISNRIADIINVKAILDIAEPDTEKFLGSNAVLRLNDGIETDISYQGHGAQRSLIFALIEAVAKHNSNGGQPQGQTKSTILLFEEPELFLHPHLIRRLKSALTAISTQAAWQVIVSTHSPVMIDIVENPQSLVILKKPKATNKIEATQLGADPFDSESKEALRATLDFHPTVNEAFFAGKVVLVEGDTEMSVLTHRMKAYSHLGITDQQYSETTIVSCGGKWTIPPIATLLQKFCVPFRIIHDEDKKGRTSADLSAITSGIDPYKANIKIANSAPGIAIHVIDDTFEDVLWPRASAAVAVSSKDKPFRSWKEISKQISDNSISNNTALKTIFDFAFNW